MEFQRLLGFLQAEGEEVRYESGGFVFPEEEEEDEEEEQEPEAEIDEPSYWRKLSAKIQARIVTGLLALLQLIFKIVNFLLTLLSRIV